VKHTPVVTDDNDLCTTDACDPATGVSHTPVSVDDGDACTVDACAAATGVSHTPVSVDDGNACTVDACNSTTGVISHTAVSVDDSNACTTDACNTTTGAITHTPVSVDDGIACTVDSCNPSTGVITHTGLFATDSILWQAPLAVSPANEDTDPSNVNPNDSKVGTLYRYAFKVGSTIPVKVRALGCSGGDVTAYSNVTGTVSVWADINCDGVGDIDLPENFSGVGGSSGLMVLTDGKLQFNLKTTGFNSGAAGCYVLQVTLTDTSTGQTTTEKVLLKAK
jgi:hypothetical protein